MEFPSPFGKYELLERIATGGMAEVFLARSFGIAGFEKRLVIKRIRPELAQDPRFVQLFITEARISVQLNHPNVVQVYDLGRVGQAWYMAMEHLHGRDLTRLVKTLRARDERLPIPVSVAITAELLRGLHYAHTRPDTEGNLLGLVHRDVSPHNVVITFDGTAKLVDFGVARLMNTVQSETEGVRDGPGGGKYAYMSPEQANAEPFDHRTDVYSAAIVLWELIAGHRLFQDPDPNEKLRRVRDAVIPDPRDEGVALDEALWQVVRKALQRNPDDRYESAALFEKTCARGCSETESLRAPPRSPPGCATPFRRSPSGRHPWWTCAAWRRIWPRWATRMPRPLPAMAHAPVGFRPAVRSASPSPPSSSTSTGSQICRCASSPKTCFVVSSAYSARSRAPVTATAAR